MPHLNLGVGHIADSAQQRANLLAMVGLRAVSFALH